MAAETAAKPLICLGEALVDLICPDPVADRSEAARFEVHCGGALANVAVAAARAGAPAGLASACGDDDRGCFLRSRLAANGVDLTFYGEVPGAPTPFAFAFLDLGREPAFEIHGTGIDAAIASLSGREEEIVAAAGAIVFGSNTLVDERSRTVTATVCERGREAGVPLLFDPNLRPGRWEDTAAARERCLPYVAAVDVVKCNLGEARWLLDGDVASAAEAATALAGLGPALAVVTAGTGEAAARGACTAAAEPPAVDLVSPLGAGDAFMGTLAAGLHAHGFDLARGGDALAAAAEQGALACTHLGAFPA